MAKQKEGECWITERRHWETPFQPLHSGLRQDISGGDSVHSYKGVCVIFSGKKRYNDVYYVIQCIFCSSCSSSSSFIPPRPSFLLVLPSASTRSIASFLVPLPVRHQQIQPEAQKRERIFLQLFRVLSTNRVCSSHTTYDGDLVCVDERPCCGIPGVFLSSAVEKPHPGDASYVVRPSMFELVPPVFSD